MKAALLCFNAYQNSKHLRSASYKSSYDTVSILSADAAHNASLFHPREREKVSVCRLLACRWFFCLLRAWGFMEKLSCDLHASCKTFPVDYKLLDKTIKSKRWCLCWRSDLVLTSDRNAVAFRVNVKSESTVCFPNACSCSHCQWFIPNNKTCLSL